MDAIVMSGEPTVGSDSQSTATLMRMCGELEQRIERGADAVPDRETLDTLTQCDNIS